MLSTKGYLLSVVIYLVIFIFTVRCHFVGLQVNREASSVFCSCSYSPARILCNTLCPTLLDDYHIVISRWTACLSGIPMQPALWPYRLLRAQSWAIHSIPATWDAFHRAMPSSSGFINGLLKKRPLIESYVAGLPSRLVLVYMYTLWQARRMRRTDT